MNKKMKELLSNVTYKNYEMLKMFFYSSGLLSYIAMTCGISDVANEVFHLSVALYSILQFSKLENYTKEIATIKSGYYEIIDNCAEFMKKLGLENPLQINTMYYNMLEGGYLSVNNQFKYAEKFVYDSNGLFGANIINGHGMCRHSASFLSDILNKSDIEAFNLPVYFSDRDIIFNILDIEDRETIEENLRKYIVNPSVVDEILDTIVELKAPTDKGYNVEIRNQKNRNIIEWFIGNHLITYAFHEGYSYYLDSTMKRIYRMNPEHFGQLLDEDDVDIKGRLSSSFLFNGIKDYMNFIKKYIKKYPSLDEDAATRLICETEKLYRDNKDLCERFYLDNKDIYEDIVHNLSFVKTNRRSRK